MRRAEQGGLPLEKGADLDDPARFQLVKGHLVRTGKLEEGVVRDSSSSSSSSSSSALGRGAALVGKQPRAMSRIFRRNTRYIG